MEFAPAEELGIDNLIMASEHYRSSTVVDVAHLENGEFVYLMNKEGKQNRSAASAEDMAASACPYCNEAIPHGHVGEVADWDLTGNKYTSTDREVLAVAKDHSPHLSPTDFRAWMHIAQATNAILSYSPARKSVPSHKHAPLFGFVDDSPLLKVPITEIEDGVGLTQKERHQAIVLDGKFEERYERTVAILRRLYAREHMYDLAITPDRTYILPSMIVGRALPKKNFLGITSTEDRTLFEYVQLPAEEQDGSFKAFNYADCDYSVDQLLELVRRRRLQVPKIQDVQDQLSSTDGDIAGVLTMGEDSVALGQYIATGLGVEIESTQFYFATDKKRNFLADCILPEFKDLRNKDLLVVVDQMTENIGNYLLGLKEKYGLKGLRVLANRDEENFALHTPDEELGWNGGTHTLLQKHNIDADSEAVEFIRGQVDEVKRILEEDGVYVEMVVALNIDNAENVAYLAENFEAATVKAIRVDQDSNDWRELNRLIQHNIVPYIRKYNPTPKRALSLIGDYRDMLAEAPAYKHEEGAIILFWDTPSRAPGSEVYGDFLDLLANNTGKRIYIVSNHEHSI